MLNGGLRFRVTALQVAVSGTPYHTRIKSRRRSSCFERRVTEAFLKLTRKMQLIYIADTDDLTRHNFSEDNLRLSEPL